MKKITLMSMMASTLILAGGYKIPETSTNSLALGGANIAHVSSADAAYDNPANMAFMSNGNHLEADLMYVGLSSTDFQGKVSGTGPHNLKSEAQTFIIPSLHYVSPAFGNIRLGLSVAVPGGLTREWTQEPAKTSAEEFTLQVVEVNPTLAYKLDNKLALALGVRVVHTNGVVKSNGFANIPALGGVGTVSRDMTGDSIDYGYNLALAYKPSNELEMALTYRSNIDLTVEGNAKLNTSLAGAPTYNGNAQVSVPLPASINLALAYTLASKTTLEVVYERTYWSAYENLDFDYDGTEGAVLGAIFGGSIVKNWNDTNAFRLGVTQELDKLTLMGAVVIDETPTPEATLGFESPGSDSISFSAGGRYELNKQTDVGLSILYSKKDDRMVKNASIDGEFSNSSALLVSVGMGYKF